MKTRRPLFAVALSLPVRIIIHPSGAGGFMRARPALASLQ